MDPTSSLTVPKIIQSHGKERQYDDLKYKKLMKVGEGTSKTVWSAFWRQNEVIAAVKVNLSEINVKEVEKELAFRKILSEHPGFTNVLQVFYVPSKKKVVWIEKLFFEDLHIVASLLHDLSPTLVYTVIEKIKGAVAFAHSKKIVLADLKPENILIETARKDEDCKVVITDLGASYYEGHPPSVNHFTFPYCSPEKMLDTHNFPPRTSDIYSLGMVMLFLVTKGRFEILEEFRDVGTYLNSLERLRDQVPQGPYQAEIQAMLQIAPSKRPLLHKDVPIKEVSQP